MMAHSQAKKRCRSHSDSRSKQEEEEEEEKHKRRKSSKDVQERSQSPISKREPEAQKLPVGLGSSKEAKKKKKEKKKKRRASSSSSQTTSSSSSSASTSSSSAEETSDEEAAAKKQRHKKAARKKDKKRKKRKKKAAKKKAKKKAAKALKEREKEEKAQWEEVPGPSLDQWQKEALPDSGPALTDEQKFRIRAMKPMTKEEWDARQSVIRKVVDPETGRMRLIKGDGEVLEEIVTKERHKEINKQATRGDGLSFEMRMGMLQ